MMKPMHDRVLVRRVEADSVSHGGIIIPDQAKEKPARGVVVAVGQGRLNRDGERVACDVSPGDEVLFGKHDGTELEVEGEKLVVMREEQILVVLT